MSRTDRRTAAAACLMSGLGCFLACALLGFPATGGVRFAWALLWAVSSVAGLRFLRLRDRRAKACFGAFGALFVLALALVCSLLPTAWAAEGVAITGLPSAISLNAGDTQALPLSLFGAAATGWDVAVSGSGVTASIPNGVLNITAASDAAEG